MKELNKKVFRTIFILLSIFVGLIIIAYNVETYKREYESVQRNLTFMERDGEFRPGDKQLERRENENYIPEPKERDFDNLMIMDYEVYTVKLNNGEIEKITSHSGETSDFNVEEIAKEIINKEKGKYIGNLYNNKYSYNYKDDAIVIMNTKSINERLLLTVIRSVLVYLVIEAMIYIVSRLLTKHITKPAKESFEKQKDFIADASHELKTPLAVIMASSDELKKDKENEKYIDNIKYESERMNTLIKSLLDLAKLEKGVSVNLYKDENISKIVEKTCLTFEAVAFEQSLSIDMNIEENIVLRCSKDEIEKLASIILDNAIKHGKENTSITVNMYKEKSSIKLEIINVGEPIKSGDEEKIFERFYRVDKSRNRESNRYGLGLAIAKNIVTNHNGTIKAFSKEGKTTFEIKFNKK